MIFFKSKKIKDFEKPDWVVFGLGNPGEEYKNTRHNIGWMVVESYLKFHKSEFTHKSKIFNYSFINLDNNRILVAVPMTYMNNSGMAAYEIIKQYNITVEKLIVVLDEYNFPLGKIHAKSGGGDGGHNGMASIIEYLGTSDFIKLRCGIGKNFGPGELVNYVLSNFNEDEVELKNKMIEKAIDAIECIIKLGKAQAFSLINSGTLWK